MLTGTLYRLSACVLLLTVTTHAQLPDDVPDFFLPFGDAEGDTTLHINDDGYSDPLSIAVDFPFFNNTYGTLFVCTNGLLTFNAGVSSYTPSPFPIASRPAIAVFWGDVDTRRGGDIYFRETTDATLLQEVTQIILETYAPRGLFYFEATWMFIATYYNVAAYGSVDDSPFRNTFQVILATDETHSFTIYHYGNLTWTYGSASDEIDAQVGFDAGDGVNYFAVPASRTPEIIDINEGSNIEMAGRWLFRIDEETIDSAEGCETDGPCAAHEELQGDGSCLAVAPALQECPRLRGPVIETDGSNTYVSFFCEFTQDVLALESYSIRFMFNNDVHETAPQGFVGGFVDEFNKSVSFRLHEQYLRGHMNEWLSCEVETYFATTPSVRSTPVRSPAYWVGVKPSQYEITVRESDDLPTDVHLISTIPITCQPTECSQPFSIHSSINLLVYQPGRPSSGDAAYNCAYYMYSQDWDAGAQRSVRADLPLQVQTVRTAFNEPDMVDYVRFTADVTGAESKLDEDGNPYLSIWTGYEPEPIVVYRVDEDQESAATCAASGDPRMSTLDGRVYSLYATGEFTLVKSTSTRVFEVQMRTYECEQTLSCACAVVVLEGNEALSLDMCDDLSDAPHRIIRFAPGSDGVQRGTITGDATGRSYTIRMQSGAFVNVYTFSWGMNVVVHVLGQDFERTTGLCGTFNNDASDEFEMRDGSMDTSSDLDAFVSSWRVEPGTSLFDNDPEFVVIPVEPPESFCVCDDNNAELLPCGGLVDLSSFSFLTFTDTTVQVFVVIIDFNSIPGVGRRRREIASNTVYEQDPTYNPSAFNYAENTTNVRNFTWPTPSGITEEEAEERCQEAIDEASCGSQNFTDLSITVEKCMLDAKETDGFNWIDDKFGEAQFTCVEEVIRTVNVTVDEDADPADTRALLTEALEQSVAAITENVCPGQCSGNGDCVNSVCQCSGDFIGVDCSVDSGVQPAITGFVGGVLCDLDLNFCTSVRVTALNLLNTAQLACRVQIVEAGRTEDTSASFQAASEVICSLPDPLDLMPELDSTVLTYRISITRDGVNHGGVAEYRVYDSACMECVDTTADCSIKDDTCAIGGECYVDQAVNPDDDCDVCVTSFRQTEWSPDPDNDPAAITGPVTFYATAGETIAVQLEAADPDGDNDGIQFLMTSQNPDVTLSSAGVLTWTASSTLTVPLTLFDECHLASQWQLSLTLMACPCAQANSHCEPQDDTAQGNYDCICDAGYTGADCATNIDECATGPCVHGTCVDGVASYTCACEDGYTGDQCDMDIDECGSNPCFRGECTDNINGYTCACNEGFEGANCDENINECLSNPCGSTGQCIDAINDYTCACYNGYQGDNCQININECDTLAIAQICTNHGACVDGIAEFSCTCDPDWTGTLCDTQINDCIPNQCEQGTCNDLEADFSCSCENGYTGELCEVNIDDCVGDDLCDQGGCVDQVAGYVCDCDIGWSGDSCSDNVEDCTAGLCNNGVCEDLVNDYRCACEAGYGGEHCNIDLNDCQPDPCVNGFCTDQVAGYVCSCHAGYTGLDCDVNIDNCTPDPCVNGACTDGVDSYTCTCDAGFTGTDCDRNICTASTCIHGSCQDVDGVLTCVCNNGFTGDLCNTNVDECASSPCVNGLCVDGLDEWSCNCNQHFSGNTCDFDTRTGDWDMWSDWGTCSTTCDPGLQTRTRDCFVPDTCSGVSSETQDCEVVRCPVDADESPNTVVLQITDSTMQQIVEQEEDILAVVAQSVNRYCSSNTRLCCQLVGVSASARADLNIFTSGDARFASGALTQRNDVITLGVVVEVLSSVLVSGCAGSRAARQADTVYVTDSILVDALDSNIQDLEALGLDVTVPQSDDDDDDDDDDTTVIAVAVGVTLGVLFLILVIILVTVIYYRSTKQPRRMSKGRIPYESASKRRRAFMPWSGAPQAAPGNYYTGYPPYDMYGSAYSGYANSGYGPSVYA